MNNWRRDLTPEQLAEMEKNNREQYNVSLAQAMSAAEAGGAGAVEAPVLGVHGGRKPMYVYRGHASDLLVEDPEHPGSYKPDKTKNVPQGCTYSTISETGKYTTLGSFLTITKLFNNPADRLLFYDPVISIGNIHTRLKRMNPDIEFHVTNQGKPYTNSHFTFLSNFEEEDGAVRFYKSGICDMSTPNPPSLPEVWTDSILIPDNKISFVHIRKIFEGSIFPTADDIISEIISYMSLTINSPDFKYVKDNTYSLTALQVAIDSFLAKKGYRTQEDLFRLLPPGNHYNIACRGFDESKPVNAGVLAEARGKSRRALEELGGQHLKNAEADRLVNLQREEKRRLASQIAPISIAGILRYVTGIENGNPDLKLRDRLIPVFREIKTEMDTRGLLLNDLEEPLKTYIRKIQPTGIALNIQGGKRTKKNRVSKKKSRKQKRKRF